MFLFISIPLILRKGKERSKPLILTCKKVELLHRAKAPLIKLSGTDNNFPLKRGRSSLNKPSQRFFYAVVSLPFHPL